MCPTRAPARRLWTWPAGRWTCCSTRRAPPCPTCAAGRSAPWRSPRAAARAPLPDTPTFAEAGLRDFEIDNFTGLVGPAGMPADAVARVHAAAVKALATAQVKERFASLGVQPVGNTPEQFGAVIREDLARWSKVIKSAGVKVE